MGEKYTPREENILEESRKIVEDQMEEKGAEKKGTWWEFTFDQVVDAKNQMEAEMDLEMNHSIRNKPVAEALGRKAREIAKYLLPVWEEMGDLYGKLSQDIRHGLDLYSANIGSAAGALTSLEEERRFLKDYLSTHDSTVIPADLRRFAELLNDPRLEEYWLIKHKEEVEFRKRD
ncbi:hypothetical protein EPN28_00535 [Patescibacteria group bacterium]|nr:MAG: hypothetical protein EPN28_00535 [Patescibacteria group bacterium]